MSEKYHPLKKKRESRKKFEIRVIWGEIERNERGDAERAKPGSDDIKLLFLYFQRKNRLMRFTHLHPCS